MIHSLIKNVSMFRAIFCFLISLAIFTPIDSYAEFIRPKIISTAIDNIRKSDKGILMDVRLLMRNDNDFGLTVEKSAALFKLEGNRAGILRLKNPTYLPAGKLEEVILELASSKHERIYIGLVLLGRDVSRYLFRGHITLKEDSEPFVLRESGLIRTPARFRTVGEAK